MSKELPYFRFTVSEWLNDDISLESYEIKGLFIDICAYYWFKDCMVDKQMLSKRFSNAKAELKQLLDLEIIKVGEESDQIIISFLDEQLDLLTDIRTSRQEAGRKGGLAKARAELKQKSSYKDKDNNKDKDKDKYIPTFKDFSEYCLTKIPNLDTKALKLKYDSWIENDWKDGNNKPIKNWKSKALNTIPYIQKQLPKFRF